MSNLSIVVVNEAVNETKASIYLPASQLNYGLKDNQCAPDNPFCTR